MRSGQLLVGSVAGLVMGVVLVVALRLYQGGAAFDSPRMTLVRTAIGVCLVALGLWTYRRARAS